MRKWGIVVSLFYAVVVVVLLVPATMLLSWSDPHSQAFYSDLRDLYKEWIVWVPIAILLSGQTILLFVSVDTSQKRARPRSRTLISVIVSSMLFALLTFAALSSLGAAAYKDKFLDLYWNTELKVIACWGVLWLLWGIVFYLYFRNSTAVTARAVSWLLKGSILELLIAVPCHVIVRRRQDCSAPVATSFGIATGIAIMLLSFGPSVLLLYKKRIDSYSTRRSS